MVAIVQLLEVPLPLQLTHTFPRFFTRTYSWSAFGHIWIDHEDEYPFSCGSMAELARGWLTLISLVVFAGPAAAAAVVAAAVTAVFYVSTYLILVLPVRALCWGQTKCFPKFFSNCECARVLWRKQLW